MSVCFVGRQIGLGPYWFSATISHNVTFSEKWTDFVSAPEHAKNMGPVTSTLLLGGFLIQVTPSVTKVQFAADAPRDPVDPAEQAALIPADAPRDPEDPAEQAAKTIEDAPRDPVDPAEQASISSTTARPGICHPCP